MEKQQLHSEQSAWRRWFAASFGIDPRSLAAFRIAVSILLLVDLAARISDFTAMYVDGGIMPIETVREFSRGSWSWSLHWLSGKVWYQGVLFGLAGGFAAMLLLGFQTRLATIASWMLLMSLHRHAPLILNGGDALMRSLLFWGMFLPLGRTWSIDSRRGGGNDRAEPVVSVPAMGILLQVCLMYWFTAIFKFMAGWENGMGLEHALQWGGYNKPLADVLLGQPTLMWTLSHGSLWLELLGPLVVLLPWWKTKFRLLVIAVFWLLHLGIELTMYVGMFSYISMTAWLLFLPRDFWRRLMRQRNLETAGQPAACTPLTLNLSCAVILALVVALNVFSVLNRSSKMKMPEPLRRFHQVTMMRQSWSMFADRIETRSWLIADAELEDGSRVDLLRGGRPVNRTWPDRVAELHKNHRWRKFAANLSMLDSARLEPFFQLYADYLFRRWNQEHRETQQVVILRLEHIRELIDSPDGREYRGRRVATVTAPDADLFEFGHDWESDQ